MTSGHVETLEGRYLLAASVVADLLGSTPQSLWDSQPPVLPVAVTPIVEPMKKSVPVIPPYGGHYEGVLTSLYFQGVQETNINGTYSPFSATELDLIPGKRRNYVEDFAVGKYINVGMGSENFADISFSGKKGTNFFKMYGSNGGYSGAPGTVDVTIKITSNAQGNRLSGSFKSVYFGMVEQTNIRYAGTFSLRRVKAS